MASCDGLREVCYRPCKLLSMIVEAKNNKKKRKKNRYSKAKEKEKKEYKQKTLQQ